MTGAAQGIGAAIAEGLAALGATVVVADLNKPGVDAVAGRLGHGSFAVAADVGEPDDVAALHADVMARTGRIDVLVNNAAIVPFTAWDDVDFTEWRRIMRVNLDGVDSMCRASSAHMRVRVTAGSLISPPTLSSPARRNMAAYVAAKGGVIGFTRALATELGPYGITVNAVSPGLVASEGVMSSPHADAFDFVGTLQALKRRGTPADIAPVAVFLASEEAGWVTGSTLNQTAATSAIDLCFSEPGPASSGAWIFQWQLKTQSIREHVPASCG